MKMHKTTTLKKRGTVIVLVVAVLALLAVIGTVYIVSARTGRAGAAAGAVDLNLELARSALLNNVRQAIGDTAIDSAGNPGGYNSTAVTYGTNAARFFDYPETGLAGQFGKSQYSNYRSEPWLAQNLYNTTGTDYSRLTENMFDPSKGTYTITIASLTNPLFSGTTFSSTASSLSSVLNDPLAPNTVAGTNADAYINLLPFSEASGIRYRVGYRIIDTNRMANLNVSSPGAVAGDYPDATGTYLTSLMLAANFNNSQKANFFNALNDHGASGIDKITNLDQANIGGGSRQGTSGATFALDSWQQQILRIEKPSTTTINFFDLSDELLLRSYGNFGTIITPRPAYDESNTSLVMWPNTLGNVNPTPSQQIVGNIRRMNYTDYSFTRELRSYADPAQNLIFTCTPVAPPATLVTPWPFQDHPSGTTTINRVPVNLTLSGSGDNLAHLGTALATSMLYTANTSYKGAITDYNGNTPFLPVVDITPFFTQDEICAFTVNFIESRWNGMIQDPNATSGYFLPAGPSFIDDQGICIRSATTATALVCSDYAGTKDLQAPSGTIYVGYAAQPFINEVAATGSAPDTVTAPTLTDFSVELYNPYNSPLSLADFAIQLGSQTPLPLSGYIPSHGFFVISFAGGAFDSSASVVAVQHMNGIAVPVTGEHTVTLYRAFIPRNAKTFSPPLHYVEIDQTDFASLILPGTNFGSGGNSNSWARDNIGSTIGVGNWGSAFEPTSPINGIKAPSLGQLNPTPPATANNGHPLYDRFAGTPEYPASTSGTQAPPFANVAEFNRTMRVCHVVKVDPANALLFDSIPANGLVTAHMAQILASGAAVPFSNMKYPTEAKLYFDFMARPQIYSTTPSTDVVPPTIQGDIRAIRFLDQLAFIDRASDTNIDVGGGTTDINKIRLPGQINVNTASGDVLRAIPNMTDQMVANILAYRDRTDTSTKYNNVASTTDYSPGGSPNYPGKGIRSLAELMVPITDAGSPSTFAKRDALWASIYNLCTVRSDTFVLYGYLEAVRANPSYTLVHNNASDWYGLVTDDPHNTTIPNLRVAKRRFIAIIDRSWCNYQAGNSNFTLPRVVAIKDLPQ